jgi:hypothetical protein
LAKWLFYDLKVFRDSKSPPLSPEELYKLFLVPVDGHLMNGKPLDNFFHLKILSACLQLVKWFVYDLKRDFRDSEIHARHQATV